MERLLEQVQDLYGLNVHFVEKVTTGFLTDNSIIADKNHKYFLKRYAYPKQEKIEEIHSIKKYFSENEIPVILPLENKKGSTFFLFDGKYFALFPFVEGRTLNKKDLSNTAIISLGQTLAKIHLAGKNSSLSIKEFFKGWNKKKLIQKSEEVLRVIKQKSELNDFDKLALRDVEARLSQIRLNTMEFEDMNLKNDHITHGDYHLLNTFFNASDQVSHVFDFEKAAMAPRVYELIKSIALIFFIKKSSQIDFTGAKLYLNSYLELYPASQEELKQGLKLYYLRFMHSLWVPYEHYIKHNYRADELLEERFLLFKYLSENLKTIEDKLLN